MFLKPCKIKKHFDIDNSTLQRWGKKGFIKYVITPNGYWLYDFDSVRNLLHVHLSNRKKVIYARVSSSKQKYDLARQIKLLRKYYPDHVLYRDIGSGINWKRKGFSALLEQILQGNIEEIVVTHKDRLCRFSFELLQQIFKHFEIRFVILCEETDPDREEELAQDLLAIVNVFVAKNKGRRSHIHKKIEHRKSSRKKDKTSSNSRSKKRDDVVDGNSKVDI